MSTTNNDIPHEEETGYGWKFLTPWMTTRYEGKEFAYPAPDPGEKWSEWIIHPDPAQYDGNDCGPGRLHVMNHIDARYTSGDWWIWFVQYRGVVGKSEEKTGAREIRLRRVLPEQLWRIIRLGHCSGANLSGANLYEANLREANLSGANLRGANLHEANLHEANLSGAEINQYTTLSDSQRVLFENAKGDNHAPV